MTPNPRQSSLLNLVRGQGFVSIEALSNELGVTLQTVRRDVQRLSEAGMLARFHGGARAAMSTTQNIAYQQRKALQAEAKSRIGRVIAQRVPNGSSLFINIGTTMEAVAHALVDHRDLRVITNNLQVASILSDAPSCQVIVAGGEMRAVDRGIVGEMAVDFIRQFKVDIGLIGISGIEPDGSLRDFDYREVQVARTIMGQSRQVWLAADHSKFLRAAIVELANVRDIDMLYTDESPSRIMMALLAEGHVECVVATG